MDNGIRRQLEGRLSSDALDFLNKEFYKMNELDKRVKSLEDREEKLLDKLHKKDTILSDIFNKHSQYHSDSKDDQLGRLTEAFDKCREELEESKKLNHKCMDILQIYTSPNGITSDVHDKALQILNTHINPQH